jgi:hypothetical protein
LIKATLFSKIIISNQFTSFKFLKNRIIESSLNQWRSKWIRSSKKRKHSQIFDIKSEERKIKLLSNRFDKLIISTLMQMKFEHDFFKSYLVRLPKYDSKNCNENCNETQNPKHLLTDCRHFRDVQSQLIKKMKSLLTTLKTLFDINERVKNLIEFLKFIRIATRKWVLD